MKAPKTITSRGVLGLRTSKKARPMSSTTAWAAGGQNPARKMTRKQERLMKDYLRYLEENRKQ